LAFVSASVGAQIRNYTMDTIPIESKILNKNRSIVIYKPINYTKDEPVKMIYLIDGEFSKYRFQSLQENKPTTNLVGVGIINTDRRRDLLYTKEANKFLDFIASEVIPVVEKGYHVGTRILYGHSFGGGFTIYALLNKPQLFDAYIASSPSPLMKLINITDYLRVDITLNKKTSLYLSYGSKDMGQVRKWIQNLNENLSGARFNYLDWKFTIFEGKKHNNSDIPALINGIAGIYGSD